MLVLGSPWVVAVLLNILLLVTVVRNVIINWIFYTSEAESAIEDSSAVLLVSLAESRVLVELGQDLVQGGHRVLAWQTLELFLYRFCGQLFILPNLGH